MNIYSSNIVSVDDDLCHYFRSPCVVGDPPTKEASRATKSLTEGAVG